MSESFTVPLTVTESLGINRESFPVTRGVPFPKSAVQSADSLRLLAPDGAPVSMQTRPLATWQDGSIRCLLVDWQADVDANSEATYTLVCDESLSLIPHPSSLIITEDDDFITVCTGPLRFRVSKRRFSLIEEAALGFTDETGEFHQQHIIFEPSPERDAIVTIQESFTDKEGNRYLYGMGGECKASLATDVYSARVEEAGPLRVVIRCDGMYEADVPMGHYQGYHPFHFTTRLYAYAGQTFVRALHTIVVACDVEQVEVQNIAFQLPHSISLPYTFLIGGEDAAAALPENGDVLFVQDNADHWQAAQPPDIETEVQGKKADGWGGFWRTEGKQFGLLVALRNFAEAFPKAIRLSKNGMETYLWFGDDGNYLNFRRYSKVIDRKSQEGIYSDGLGTAKTSEFFLHFFTPTDIDRLAATMRQFQHPLHVRLDPAWCDRCEVTGGFAPRNSEKFPAEENMMSELLAWLERHITTHQWFGMFDYGDVKTGYDYDKGEWRDRGRWGWDNSEWDFRHGVWIQYLRTGDEKWFRWGEAFTRHSADVDTCHYHPLRPYFVGGCFRHSVDHWGDEPCASHTFLENWLDYYFLTGDGRTLDVIREAGEFFMRYKWTHHPRYSFSLRTIANVFRGLLHLYELTWEERFLKRAEELLDIILRGQNDDGSWYKRFVVCKDDRLPEYLPFGLATEGTTTAIEMGTMPPFNADELSPFNRPADLPELTPEELKGYQTHYLMVGLEQYHRLTGRADVAAAYVKAVDWFCGRENGEWKMESGELHSLHIQHAIKENYYGILPRECAYAYELTGDKRYLEIGRALVNHLVEKQDKSDNPLRRGSVLSVDPLPVSMLFWGVPYFLRVWGEAQ
jgi:hypothetical protein